MTVGNREGLNMFNFFKRLDKDHEKTPESAESWVLVHNSQMSLNRLA